MTQHTQTLGILAYGSLIDEPGDELQSLITRTIRDVVTPFPVEFARRSSSRGDAPTLVPYSGGASVRGAILVVEASAAQASDILWRRETRKTDVTLSYPGVRPDRPNAVRIEQITGLAGVDLVLYTSIDSNVTPLTAEHLADLAIASVAKAELGKDGISYLAAAKANGIVTPLSPAYEAEILRKMSTDSLARALAALRPAAA